MRHHVRIPRTAEGAVRELRPALTADEMAESDSVYRDAMTRNLKLVGRHPVRVVVRCNQLSEDFTACDWSETFETTAGTADQDGHARIAQHLVLAHPYLDTRGRANVLNATWVNLRDV